jgi:rhamnosyltransferase subunit B
MRALLITAGSHGDINPYIAIGRALRARGIDAAIMTNPWFEPEIRRAGLGFVAAYERGVDIREFIRANPWMNDPRVAGKRLFRDVILPTIPELLDHLQGEVERNCPDVVAVHPLALGAPAVCMARGIPWASVALAPSVWLSRDEAVCMLPLPPWGVHPPLWSWRMMRIFSLALIRRWIDDGINRVLQQRGLPVARDQFLLCTRGGEVSLAMWHGIFRAPVADDPTGAVVCGFPWHDESDCWKPPAELQQFLASGPPPVVFSLGTASVHAPGRFYEFAATAAARLNVRAILLTGRGSPLPRTLPPHIIAIPYAPFAWLLPRSAATVHHGGIGTTAEALRSGRPMVVVPHAHDQFDNAARAERLGVSRTVMRLNLRSLERALSSVLEDPDCDRRAAALAPQVVHDGAQRAAVELLRMARRTMAVSSAREGAGGR